MNSTPIDRHSLGREGVAELSPEAIGGILDAPSIPIPESRRIPAESALKKSIIRWMHSALCRHLSKREYKELKKAFEGVKAYTKLSRELQQVYFHPSPPPPDWLENALGWFAEMEKFYPTGGGTGRRPDAWGRRFYPEALGLFAAIYDRRPTATAAGDGSKAGPAALFLKAVIKETRTMLELHPFAKAEDRDLALKCWTVPTGSKLKQRISWALAPELSDADRFHDLCYQQFEDWFQAFFFSPETG